MNQGGLHIVRAAALNDPVGDFEREILKVGNAIAHDKIVVIDPLADNCVVANGSHNLGFKASYENDENLLIFLDARALAQAYPVHVCRSIKRSKWSARAHRARSKLYCLPCNASVLPR
jgi:phosphatidylserine/phosphatidylglycerophosphate/cardiolipin synthase-like enzyme